MAGFMMATCDQLASTYFGKEIEQSMAVFGQEWVGKYFAIWFLRCPIHVPSKRNLPRLGKPVQPYETSEDVQAKRYSSMYFSKYDSLTLQCSRS